MNSFSKRHEVELTTLALELSSRKSKAVQYRKEPFRLRGGDLSHWYADHKRGLAPGDTLGLASRLIIAKAETVDMDWDIVAGSGVAGRALTNGVALLAHKYRVLVNDDKSDTDPLDGYGLHGEPVQGKKVLPVDDIGSTGSSLITLIGMVRDDGGIVEHAINVSDRSRGRVAAALAEIGVAYHYLLDFYEEDGLLRPAA